MDAEPDDKAVAITVGVSILFLGVLKHSRTHQHQLQDIQFWPGPANHNQMGEGKFGTLGTCGFSNRMYDIVRNVANAARTSCEIVEDLSSTLK